MSLFLFSNSLLKLFSYVFLSLSTLIIVVLESVSGRFIIWTAHVFISVVILCWLFMLSCICKNELLLEYSCFTMLCSFLVYSKMNQLYLYIYPHFFWISFPFRSPQSME